jgi:hypothetical protein
MGKFSTCSEEKTCSEENKNVNSFLGMIVPAHSEVLMSAHILDFEV